MIATVVIFVGILLNGILFGNGGLITGTPTPKPTPVVTASPSSSASPSASASAERIGLRRASASAVGQSVVGTEPVRGRASPSASPSAAPSASPSPS